MLVIERAVVGQPKVSRAALRQPDTEARLPPIEMFDPLRHERSVNSDPRFSACIPF